MRNKLALLLATALLAIVVLVVALVVVPRSDQGKVGTGEVSDPAQYGIYVPAGPIQQISTDVPGLEGSVTPGSDLSGVDPRGLYWAMLKRQSMKTVTDYVHVKYDTERTYELEYPGALSAHRVAIDYENRQFIDESTRLREDGEMDPRASFARCVDGNRSYHREHELDGPPRWEPGESEIDASGCSGRLQPGERISNSWTSDGVAAGGLTSQEADRFISYLVNIPDLVTMSTPEAVEGDDGQTYLQLDVQLNQIDPRLPQNPHNVLAGAAFLNAAFAQTGKDPFAYPYSIDIGSGQGRMMRYFIDPETLLPAYSVTKVLPPRTIDGSQANDIPVSYIVLQYRFPEQLDEQAMKAEGHPELPYEPLPFDQVFFQVFFAGATQSPDAPAASESTAVPRGVHHSPLPRPPSDG